MLMFIAQKLNRFHLCFIFLSFSTTGCVQDAGVCSSW